MSIQWADIPSGDTGIYGTTTAYMTNGIWAERTNVTLVDDPDPNITGNVLSIGNGRARFVLSATQTVVGLASRIWLPGLPSAELPAIFQWRDVNNTVVLAVLVTTTGALRVVRDVNNANGAYTIVGETTGPVVTANAWRHIEVWATHSTTVGEVVIHVEGREVLNLTGVNTGANAYAQVVYGSNYSLITVGYTPYFKDIVIADGNGSENNTFLGTVGVYRQMPNNDVSNGWSLSSGLLAYELVDEAPPDDAGYIYAGESPIPAPAIMNLEMLPPDIVSIRAILPFARVQKSDGGDGSFEMSLSPNGTDWDVGSDWAASTAFTYYWDVSELSPDTTSPWTPGEFATIEYRIDRTT